MYIEQGCCRCISNKVRKQEQESRIQVNGSEAREGEGKIRSSSQKERGFALSQSWGGGGSLLLLKN